MFDNIGMLFSPVKEFTDSISIDIPDEDYDLSTFSERNVLETLGDFSTAFWVPLFRSNGRALAFGLGAIAISMISSFFSDTKIMQERRDDDILSPIPSEDVIQALNLKDNTIPFMMDSEKRLRLNPLTNRHFMKALISFGDFLKWSESRMEDDNKWIVKEVFDLAVKRARGEDKFNPTDVFLQKAFRVIGYISSSIFSFTISSLF